MTRLVISARAARDIERLADFLVATLPDEAARTAELIFSGLEILKQHPAVGRRVRSGFLRELVISRGRSGYVALYRFDPQADLVAVYAIRHQREAGFGSP